MNMLSLNYALCTVTCIHCIPVGENSIVITSGANDQLSPADVERAESLISSAAVVICQLEVPPKTTLAALALAKKYGGICRWSCHAVPQLELCIGIYPSPPTPRKLQTIMIILMTFVIFPCNINNNSSKSCCGEILFEGLLWCGNSSWAASTEIDTYTHTQLQ